MFFMLFMLCKNQIDFYTFLALRGTKYIVPLPRFLTFLLVIAKGNLHMANIFYSIMKSWIKRHVD